MLGQVEAMLDPGGELDKTRLSQLKMSLQEKFETLKHLDEEILEMIDDEGLEEEIEQADAFKERFFAASASMDRLRLSPTTAQGEGSTTHPTVADGRTHASPTLGAVSRVRLPKLSLRKFEGDITTWTSNRNRSCSRSTTPLSGIRCAKG